MKRKREFPVKRPISANVTLAGADDCVRDPEDGVTRPAPQNVSYLRNWSIENKQ